MASSYVKSTRTILPDLSIKPATVVIEHGMIREVLDHSVSPRGIPGIDVGTSILMPGLVDTHVHINEPGRTEWEGFETATDAAAAGGITTVVDMPLNSIPATTSVAALRMKQEAARGHCKIDYALWGGVIPGNAGELSAMVDAGAVGFKAFMIDSGVDEFPMSTEKDLRAAMPILASKGVPLLVHAELEGSCPHSHGNPRAYSTFLESRPRDWEIEAIRLMIRLSRETGCHVHIVHLSAADALDDIKRARASGVKITAETCPHYLYFAAEEIPEGATQFKCTPPIRERENRERLWQGLREGAIDFIVSDHSPCTPRLKKLEQGLFDEAWGGISGLQFGLSVVWTAMKNRGFGPEYLYKWMSQKPAEFLHIPSGISKGSPANLVVWNPERTFRLEEKIIRHKHRLTPYADLTLHGLVEKTFVRGVQVHDEKVPISGRIGIQFTRGATP